MRGRLVDIGTQNFTQVYALDEKGSGGANHIYEIRKKNCSEKPDNLEKYVYGFACFQNGPIKENGANGCHNEDLIAIVIDRLQGFQSGEFACRENAIAITKLEEALMWLNKRTSERIKRGVEGRNIV